MPIISQGLTLPGNVQTGGTIQASDVATLYSAMNAFNIPGTIGVFQQALVDNNRYQSTGTGTIDWSFATAANKSLFFFIPFTWSGSTGINNFQLRINGAAATTSTGLTFSNASSGDGFMVGFIGPRSTDVNRGGFVIGMDSINTTFKASNISVSMTTSDISSVGFLSGSTAAGATFVYNGVRFWNEG